MYNDIHRSILRAFVRETAIEETALLDSVNAMIKKSSSMKSLSSMEDLDSFVALISKKMDEYGLYLKLVKRRAVELDGLTYWVLVNFKSDMFTKLGTGLKDSELIGFKEILRLLVKSKFGNLLLSEMNLADTGARNVEMESLVKKLVEGKWLVWDHSAQGKFTAGIRTLTELDQELRDLGAHECEKMGTAVILTKAYKNWFFNVTGRKFETEPTNDEDKVSETVATMGETEETVKKSANSPKRRRKKHRGPSSDEDSEEAVSNQRM